MLSILISSEYFATKPDLIIDEFIGMFMAGMKTSQATLTNLIQYLCLNPTVKTRLLAEITPVLHEIKHDIRNNLEWEKLKTSNSPAIASTKL
jgi:cytochrome P450